MLVGSIKSLRTFWANPLIHVRFSWDVSVWDPKTRNFRFDSQSGLGSVEKTSDAGRNRRCDPNPLGRPLRAERKGGSGHQETRSWLLLGNVFFFLFACCGLVVEIQPLGCSNISFCSPFNVNQALPDKKHTVAGCEIREARTTKKETMVKHIPFVGIYSGIVTPGFLSWCERISPIHSRCPVLG